MDSERRWRGRFRALSLLSALFAGASCSSRTPYACDPAHPCASSAQCLAEGHCATRDPMCASGFRYTATGPSPLQCAPAQDGAISDASDAAVPGDTRDERSELDASDAGLDVVDASNDLLVVPDGALDAAVDEGARDDGGEAGDARDPDASDAPIASDAARDSDTSDVASSDAALDAPDADANGCLPMGGADAVDVIDAADVLRPRDGAPTDSNLDAPPQSDATAPPSDAMCALAPPRQLSPLSTYRVVSQKPALRVVVQRSASAVVLELARDRAFTSIAHTYTATVEAPDAGPANLAMNLTPFGSTAGRLDPGVWFWRVRSACADRSQSANSPVWQFRVPIDPTEPLTARSAASYAATAGGIDLNGDGLDDLVVGAPGRRAVYVYFGTRGALACVTPVEVTGGAAYDGAPFGSSIANAGDVNGDGFGDVLVGSCPRVEGEVPGTCPGLYTLIYGGPGPITSARIATRTVPGAFRRGGIGVDGVGDISGDGYGDVALGNAGAAGAASAYLLYGSEAGPATAYELPSPGGFLEDIGFGFSIAGVGAFDTALGTVHLGMSARLSRLTTLDTMTMRATGYATIATEPGGNFGATGALVASAGDLDGDGRGDVAVANESSPGIFSGFNRTRAQACFGVAGGAAVPCVSLITEGADSGARRESLAGGGDVNGDGFDDLLVVVRAADNTGRPTVRWVIGDRLRTRLATRVLPCARAGAIPAGYAFAATMVGDFDGDGLDDVALSSIAPETPDAGPVANGERVELVRGSAATTLDALCDTAQPLMTPPGLGARSFFGYALR